MKLKIAGRQSTNKKQQDVEKHLIQQLNDSFFGHLQEIEEIPPILLFFLLFKPHVTAPNFLP